MKWLTTAVIVLATQNLMAHCLGEAQIIAQVGAVKHIDSQSCVIHVEPTTIVQYNESGVCPLDLSMVLISGVKVGLASPGVCALDVSDPLSGVLVLKDDGSIEVE